MKFRINKVTVELEFPSIYISNENMGTELLFMLKIFGKPLKSQHRKIYVAPFKLFSYTSVRCNLSDVCELCGGPIDECDKYRQFVGATLSECCTGMTDDPSYNNK